MNVPLKNRNVVDSDVEWKVDIINYALLYLSFISFCRDNLESYTSDYTAQVLVGYCLVYIFMQTFMILGSVFMSLLAGALFDVFKGEALSQP
ncbi:hypothetical protein P8452_71305 [Trifolium repens]|nr:hypothetical protein P8452_71305 [Trifolium repens]